MHELNFGSLKQRLLLGGVAPKYVTRTIHELRNHLEELKQAARNECLSEQEVTRQANSKLGEEDAIVKAALTKSELKSWSHRYTKSVYVFTPFVFYVCATLAIIYVVAGGIPALIGFGVTDPWSSWYIWLIRFALFFTQYFFAPLLAILICVMAKRRNIATFWPIVGLLIVTFIGSGWETQLRIPTEELRGTISMHWGYAFMPWRVVQSYWGVTIEQLIRCGMAIGMAVAVLRYYRPYKHTTA